MAGQRHLQTGDCLPDIPVHFMYRLLNLVYAFRADLTVPAVLLQAVNPHRQQEQGLCHPVMQLFGQAFPCFHCVCRRPLLFQLPLVPLHNPEERQQQDNTKHEYQHRR
ncbi:hypothetical protein D3C73_1393030 [compost metagenome]